MKLSETGLKKNPTKLGVGEEHMTPNIFWLHYLDCNSVVPSVYPASLLSADVITVKKARSFLVLL